LKFLIIQTAFIGDVILATAIAEKLYAYYPEGHIDFVVRQGNDGLLTGHPFIKTVYVWNKKQNKIRNLFSITRKVRAAKYDHILNLHRFSSSGVITGFSSAGSKAGFDKNPLSFLFTTKIKHEIGNGKHEVERNQQLIETLTDKQFAKPKLYPSLENFAAVKNYKNEPYVCIAPASVWFTKQFPKEKWVELCDQISSTYTVYLLGAPSDKETCEKIISATSNKKVINLAGKLNFLESAALMKDAIMNYVNDSAPMHMASAMNAPTTAIFCSTVPAFGFGPLSDNSRIVETMEQLSCRPCGLHGHAACPEGHFKCALSIDVKRLI
jgi:ADP-heptose:LPS heptosyltransferase